MPSSIPAPVIVNVYDLADFNVYLNWCGLGAYHSGLQIHGREYAYGAHPYDCSGIFDTAPLEAPGDVSFRTSIYVGDTYYTADELEDLIAHMGREYLGRRYHLLQTNCNSFTSDACFALCGERPPDFQSAPNAHAAGPIAESQQQRPLLMERMGSDDSVTLTSRSFGGAGLLSTSDPVPRGNSPCRVPSSSANTVDVLRLANSSMVDGACGGLQVQPEALPGQSSRNPSRRKKDSSSVREQVTGFNMSDQLDNGE